MTAIYAGDVALSIAAGDDSSIIIKKAIGGRACETARPPGRDKIFSLEFM